MVSARPAATWLARKFKVMRPNSAAMVAPEQMAMRTAATRLPVLIRAAKAARAPTTIMPSTPGLRTPARSATSSPVAASTSGVAAIMTLMRMLLRRSTLIRPLRSLGRRLGWPRLRWCERAACLPARSIVHQHVGCQHEEQEHALEGGDGGAGQAHADLRHLAADAGQRQQQAGEQNAKRTEPPEKGNDDGGKSITRRQLGHELADGPGGLEQSGQSGSAARQQQRKPNQARL